MPYFQTSDGLSLYYTDQGEGAPIICLPGLTRNSEDFGDFIASFTTNARIITLTSRGREPSDFDPNWQNYSVTQEANDAIALLDHLDIPKAMFLGSSRGGLVSMMIAMTQPERIAGVVLNDVGPELAAEGLERIMDYLGIAPDFRTKKEAISNLKSTQGARFDFDDAIWERLVKRWYHFDDKGAHIKYDPKLRDAMLSALGALKDADPWPLFDALAPFPLGLIWGANSDLILESHVKAMQARNPNLRLGKIPHRGHIPLLDEGEALRVIEEIYRESFKAKN